MSQSLADRLPDGSGKAGIRVWLKSSGYARRLLLGEASDPWTGAAQYLALFSQADGLLRPDVAVLDIGEFYDSWLARHPDLKTEMGSKRRPAFALRKLLETEAPRRVLAEIVEAVIAKLGGSKPLVLSMPSPRHWLVRASQIAGHDDIEIDADAIENAAMYMADFVRPVSAYPVGGLLLEEDPAATAVSDEDVQCYRPLINVARHYRWGVVFNPGAQAALTQESAQGFDAVVSVPSRPLGKAAGLDVGDALWDGQPLPSLNGGQFYFAEIPAREKPESVLEKLALLRA